MAPLTRNRSSGIGRVPNKMMREYYVQRASAGMIITEATSVSPLGVGYPHTPGVWSDEQINGWREIVNGVHDVGGKILLQLWHVGRISDPIYLNGELPVAPSAIAAKGTVSLLRPKKNFVTPRALDLKEIPAIIESFRSAALNAKKAGFDGVEIHGANGYLLDQFLQDSTNHRTDIYGGSIENRVRLMLEVVDAVCSVWGADFVGLHLAPRGDLYDMGDSNPAKTFRYLATELSKRKLAFICARESVAGKARLGPIIRSLFNGVYIANEGFDGDTAQKLLDDNEADAIAFGKLFISNPDLPYRLEHKETLTAWDDSTFYSEGEKGYTDYPCLEKACCP
jgi:hypothetical protein